MAIPHAQQAPSEEGPCWRSSDQRDPQLFFSLASKPLLTASPSHIENLIPTLGVSLCRLKNLLSSLCLSLELSLLFLLFLRARVLDCCDRPSSISSLDQNFDLAPFTDWTGRDF